MPPILRIQILGDFRWVDSDEAFLPTINQSRQQALLAYLLLHHHAPQSRPYLSFLLWPDSNEKQAQTNLRKALVYLRRAAPFLDQAIFADAKIVQWRPSVPFFLDVAEFEANIEQANVAKNAGRRAEAIPLLAAAVHRYAGPLLPSCYDEWIIPERERLHQMCLRALEQLVALHESQPDFATAIDYAQRLLRLDPLQETTYLQLMRLQALQGDRAGALRTYHTCATRLERDLGVEPGEETQAAYARLLRLEAPTTIHATVTNRAHLTAAARLVGRQAEWGQLQAVWRLASQHRARFVCVLGEAGIGKTHLAEEMLTWASQQGFAVARTRAYAGESQLAYAPVIEWLRAEPVRAARQRLASVWLSEVARLTPEILTEEPAVPAPAPITERWQRQQLWEALARVLLAAPQPLLLLIDDLQWCDQETLEWLYYLLHFDPRARILVLGTARPEEIDDTHPLSTLLRHLRGAEQLTELELGPLDAEQTAVLVAQIAQQPVTLEVQQALYRATAGNPLFVVETVRAAASDQSIVPNRLTLPPKVQAIIEARLAQLSPTARDLAHLAAVSGQAFNFDLLVLASGSEEDRVMHALDELWRRRIVREQGINEYDFSHDRIRDVAYAECSPVRRRQLHRKLAAALEQIHANDLNGVSARIAAQYRQAGDAAKAAAYYLRAAHQMQFGYAHAEMIAHLQQGLTLLQDQPRTAENVALEIAMYLALGRTLTAREMWGSPSSVEAFEAARRLCLASNNLAQLVQAQDYLQIAYSEGGDLKRALTLAQSNLDLVAKADDSTATEGTHGSLGYLLWCSGNFSLAREHLAQAAKLAAEVAEVENSPRRALSYPGAFPQALVLWLLGYPDSAERYLQAVLAAQEPYASPFDRMTGYEFCVMFYHWRRELRQMQVFAQKLLAVTEQYEYTTYQWLGQLYTTAASVALGEPNAGSNLLRRSIEAVKGIGVLMHIPYALFLLAEVYGQAGQPTAAILTLDEALTLSAKTGEHLWEAETYRLRGDLLYAEGSLQEAEFAYQRAVAVTRQQHSKMLELRATVSLARLWQQQGRSTEAHQMLVIVCEWFTEGFDTVDLKAARALLDTLAGSASTLPSG